MAIAQNLTHSQRYNFEKLRASLIKTRRKFDPLWEKREGQQHTDELCRDRESVVLRLEAEFTSLNFVKRKWGKGRGIYIHEISALEDPPRLRGDFRTDYITLLEFRTFACGTF